MRTFLPTLLKTDSKGITQEWRVYTHTKVDGTCALGTIYGRQGGKMIEHEIIIKAGKNIGRSNETTPTTQALAEAQSAWNDKVKKGYSSSGQQEEQRGVMLATDYYDLAKRKIGVNLPETIIVSPKLDGIRCKMLNDQYMSRNNILYRAIPQRIQNFMRGRGPVDGEMYIHQVSLRKLNGLVNKPDPELTPRLGYHLFDLPIPRVPVEERKAMLVDLYDNEESRANGIFVVPYFTIDSARVEEYKNRFTQALYEGVMINLLGAPYEWKRSRSLIKWKDFLEAEFMVVDVGVDREGHALAVCEHNGVRFEVTLKAEDWMKEDLANNPDKILGKPLTTRFQGFLDSGKPQFARGMVERIYE